MIELPKKTEHGKYRLGQWKIPPQERGKKYSEGYWELTIDFVSIETGIVRQLKRTVWNCNLWSEGMNIEKALRKKKCIVFNINFKKI